MIQRLNPFDVESGIYLDSINPTKSSIKEQILQDIQDSRELNYRVVFSTESVSYCVALVDMIDSTKIVSRLGIKKMSKYYECFLNLMSRVICKFDGKIVKNIGDCLMFYFPKTSSLSDRAVIKRSIECCIAMTQVHDYLCSQMKLEGLPCIDYRISMDYGSVMPMKTSDSEFLDMIGPPVNMCSKINHLAEKNGVVIGGDLYEIAKHLGFSFRQVHSYSIGFKQSYPTYSVR